MPRRNCSRLRAGFTLIELLVVVAIVAVLVGLTLPAVQKVRSSAQRIKCGNQLRQMTIASQNAHSAIGTLPPGIGHYPADGNSYGTFFYHLLPYLEHDSLYQRSFNSGTYFVGNNQVFAQPVAGFVCPADPSALNPAVGKDVMGNNWGLGSYAVNAQVVCTVDANGHIQSPEAHVQLGVDIADGASNTILLAEKYAQCFNGNYPVGGNYWAYYFTGPNLQPYHPGFAVAWNPYSIGPSSKFQVMPNPYNGKCDPTMASSPHTAGIQIGMADGSVRFLSADITMYTWWYLCTPNGGEAIPGDAF